MFQNFTLAVIIPLNFFTTNFFPMQALLQFLSAFLKKILDNYLACLDVCVGFLFFYRVDVADGLGLRQCLRKNSIAISGRR